MSQKSSLPQVIQFVSEALMPDRKENYNKKAPSNATLKRERACLLPLFKFAMSKGYITKLPEMDPPNTR